MERFSVKKPFTVLVAVVMVVVLGFVALSRMTTDLLPPMSLPYMIVITTYPGASPEKIEAGVTQPMENGLGTISGVKNVYSSSNENYSMVELEFEDGTDMDSAMVKVSSAVQQVSAALPDACGTPSIMEVSMDMMATLYTAVSRDGLDIYETSDFVRNDVVPYLERQDGVASVSSVGMVEKSVSVELDADKIDALNDEILASVDSRFADAKKEMESARRKVEDGQAELDRQQATFGSTMSDAIFSKLTPQVTAQAADLKQSVDALRASLTAIENALDPDSPLRTQLAGLSAQLGDLSLKLSSAQTLDDLLAAAHEAGPIVGQISALLGGLDASLDGLREPIASANAALENISGTLSSTNSLVGQLQTVYAQTTQGQLDAAVAIATAKVQLNLAEQQLDTAEENFETQRKEALKQANLDSLLNLKTLSQLIYAQNFAMPAGYIDDENDDSWLLKVGEEYNEPEDIANALLVSMEPIGDIRLSDVATITVIDNADESYARLNGENAVVLCVYKASTAGTNDVSAACANAFTALSEKYSGMHAVTLMDQGSYITMIVQSVLSSMAIGALLAIVVLALFLKDLRPTLVVGISIPLSVLFALVLMYFSNISLNMMTLSGLSLGIGMLVDNSIVVMENIYRLRNRGVGAPRAAVQGAKQVTGAIVSSTLTTVCVFLPMIFTTGTVRELLVPMALTIIFCLMASLIVAMTVVPATASTLLKNTKPKSHKWFDKIQEWYGKSLAWCLRFKAVPLVVSIALLGLCIWQVARMGIVMLPEMASNQVQLSVTTPEGMTREESYATIDAVNEAILGVDGIADVGMMDESSTTGLVSSMAGPSDVYGSYTGYVSVDADVSSGEMNDLCDRILAATSDFNCTVTASAGGLTDLSSMTSGGLSVKVYGDDMDEIRKISEDVVGLVNEVEGFENATNGVEEGAQTIHLSINKDTAMRYGLTVAQIYAELSSHITTSATAATITVGGVNMDVVINNNTDPLTAENLMDLPFECTVTDDDGNRVTETHPLSDFATKENTTSVTSVSRENQSRYLSVTADTAEGYNTTLLCRTLQDRIDAYEEEGNLPEGMSIVIGGESEQVNKMVFQMVELLALGLLFIYLVMVAQFQSLLSPFIVLFTIPLAFTGGLLGLLAMGQQLSLLSLMGFVVLMGTVVNNGIVFVDYTNQLRMGGMERRPALIAAGKTRMRPIFMTAMTTILAMTQLIFGDDMGSQLGGGMAIVIAAGLAYATIMTLYIVPVMYDILSKRTPRTVDLGSENLDDVPDDAAEFIAAALKQEQQEHGEDPMPPADEQK